MALDNRQQIGLNHTPSYQVPGIPWVTSSLAVGNDTTIRIGFPNVTKKISVKNSGENPLLIGFTEAGIESSRHWQLPSSGTIDMDLRIRDLFLRAEEGSTTVDVLAGLTNINRIQMPKLTGSLDGNGNAPSGSIYRPGV